MLPSPHLPANRAAGREVFLTGLALAVIVLTAVFLRLVPVIFIPSQAWPDEVFQSTEQAHRLVYGTGLVPWEFQLGVRSWLLPGAIAGLMEMARLAGDGPDIYLPVIAIAFGVLAAVPAICCYFWGSRYFGVGGGLVGAAVVAVAPELVYFGARTLAEVVAGHLLVAAIYLLEPGRPADPDRRLVAGGALLGLVGVLRVQLAPALLLITIWAARRGERRRAASMIIGASIVIGLAGLLDAVTLGYPLASIGRYVFYNVAYGASFGVEPYYYYFAGMLGVWGLAFAPMAFLIVLGARRLPVLLAAATIIVAVHSAIPHKEYRFVYPAIVCLMVLAGIGLGEVVVAAQRRLSAATARNRLAPTLCVVLAVASWCLLSVAVWERPPLTMLRNRMRDYLAAVSYVAHGPAPCGIGLYGRRGYDWLTSDGYTYLHRPARLYWPKDPATLISAASAFDTLIAVGPIPAGLRFIVEKCFGRVCVARRHGDCHPAPAMPMPFPPHWTA